MQPGQSLDAATLASLVETAIAHAALMAVAAEQEVELTAETLATFIAAHKGDELASEMETIVDRSFRARSVAKKLVKETTGDLLPVRTARPATMAGYQPGPDDITPGDADRFRITSGRRYAPE